MQREASRQRITTVLNLNTKGSLARYLVSICEMLKLDLHANVYATNACKCFFTKPPTAIYKHHGVDVIKASAGLWLPLLHDELAHFPQATFISLGEPVLNLLVRDGGNRLMKSYWGYTRDWQQGTVGNLSAIEPEFSTLNRRISRSLISRHCGNASTASACRTISISYLLPAPNKKGQIV